MIALKGIHVALLNLKQLVESQGGEPRYLNLAPDVAERAGVSHGDVLHLMEVRIDPRMPKGDALITKDLL